jgi:hypothetical protein
MLKKESMSTWLDFEMGRDMTRQIEYGDNMESPRMSMLPMCIPQDGPRPPFEKMPPQRPPINDEEDVKASCSEKTEG